MDNVYSIETEIARLTTENVVYESAARIYAAKCLLEGLTVSENDIVLEGIGEKINNTTKKIIANLKKFFKMVIDGIKKFLNKIKRKRNRDDGNKVSQFESFYCKIPEFNFSLAEEGFNQLKSMIDAMIMYREVSTTPILQDAKLITEENIYIETNEMVNSKLAYLDDTQKAAEKMLTDVSKESKRICNEINMLDKMENSTSQITATDAKFLMLTAKTLILNLEKYFARVNSSRRKILYGSGRY